MNIVTPIPTAVVFPTSNLNVESARRDNLARETIPQPGANENSEPEKGLGSENDRARRATGQFNSPLVYERPTVQATIANQNAAGAEPDQRDNGSDESAGREDAEQQQQSQAEQREVRELKARDAEVRAHEQAHAAVGGQYAGSPQYEFQTGPDGQRYAVGGSVSIDISEETSPEATLQKMQQVRAAALAPADPSPQDLRVAAEANQKAFEARSEILEESRREVVADVSQSLDESEQSATGPASEFEPPSLDDIVDSNRISTPTRTLDQAELNEEESEQGVRPADEIGTRTLNIDEDVFARRNNVIAQFYAGAVTPEPERFSATA